ncbi:DUF3040 domain-containing protein [Actinomadura livida]|nr:MULTISPECIES: DUF3040 domain-containing protein [Actinomadura]MBB4772588.1 hypothetical protein [Actinomadura catellatispora]
MGLSEYERTVLRQLDAELHREDPRLRRRLTEFTAPPEDAPEDGDVTWRPPRAAVALAAVMLAAVTFMMVMIPLVMRQPCRVPATGSQTTAGTVAPSSAGPHPGYPARDAGDRAAEPGAGRPSPSPTC